jgi:hypothetical protein
MNQLEIAQQAEIEKLQRQNEQMKQLGSGTGFYEAYWQALKTAPSNKAAFDEVNDLHFDLFKMYRYSDYNSFKVMQNYNSKKKK